MSDEIPPEASKDPEIVAEQKKTLLWHIRLERYREIATALGFFLQTFKAEAVSLVSGLGTLAVGWFQLRKMAATSHVEVGAIKIEARVARAKALTGLPKAETVTETQVPVSPTSALSDPISYVSVGLPAVFIAASIKAWLKRKKKAPIEVKMEV